LIRIVGVVQSQKFAKNKFVQPCRKLAPLPRQAKSKLSELFQERQSYFTSPSLWTANNVPLANIDAVDALAASAVLVASLDHETISPSCTTGSQIRLHEGASGQ
tara:strand:- start:72 stop:383 length:312 start_codon:yes stop_codon:yes gene_type:complete